MSKGVAVYDYFPDDDDEEQPTVTAILTDDQTSEDMARMLVESFGRAFAIELAAALGKVASDGHKS